MPDTVVNKVKFGLKNVHYAPITAEATDGTPTFGTPVHIPGAVNLSLDAEGDQNVFRADNIDYYVSNSNNGYSGSLEMALIPDDFRVACLGEAVGGNGLVYEDSNAKAKGFALMFQFEGDQKATRHVMYKCIATRPSIASETTDTTIEPVTESMDLTCSSIYAAAVDAWVPKARCTEGDAAYANFFDAVTLPTT